MTIPSPRGRQPGTHGQVNAAPHDSRTDDSPIARRALAVAAVLEPLSLLVLVLNLVTVHISAVASVVGPLHGSAYLAAIAATWTGGHPRGARLWAWLPGIGASLAQRAAVVAPGSARRSTGAGNR